MTTLSVLREGNTHSDSSRPRAFAALVDMAIATSPLHLQGHHSHVVSPTRLPSFIEDHGWELGEMKGQGPTPEVPEFREIERCPGSVGHQQEDVPWIDPLVDGKGNNLPAT